MNPMNATEDLCIQMISYGLMKKFKPIKYIFPCLQAIEWQLINERKYIIVTPILVTSYLLFPAWFTSRGEKPSYSPLSWLLRSLISVLSSSKRRAWRGPQCKLWDNEPYKIFDNDIYLVHQTVLEYRRESISGLSNSGTAVLLGSYCTKIRATWPS